MPSWRRQSAGQIRRGPVTSPRINIPQNDALQLLAAPPSTGNAGLLYAGDSAWTIVGSGAPAPVYQNSWAAVAGYVSIRFRKFSDGLVLCEGVAAGGANGTIAFTFPAGYRPGGQIIRITEAGIDVAAVAAELRIQSTGTVQVSTFLGGPAQGTAFYFTFYAEN